MFKQTVIPIIVFIVLLSSGCGDNTSKERNALSRQDNKSQEKRAKSLEHLLSTFSFDVDVKNPGVPIWEHWLHTSGELPPDFDELEPNAFLHELLCSVS